MSKQGGKGPKPSTGLRDECVALAIQCLWNGWEAHLKEKLIFPRIVSHGVARTVAAMVHMVASSQIRRMESWQANVEGRVAKEWLYPEEPVLFPLDTWARGVVPMKRQGGSEGEEATSKPIRSASAMALSVPGGPLLGHEVPKSPLRRHTQAESIASVPKLRFNEPTEKKSSDRRKINFEDAPIERKKITSEDTSPGKKERRKTATELNRPSVVSQLPLSKRTGSLPSINVKRHFSVKD